MTFAAAQRRSSWRSTAATLLAVAVLAAALAGCAHRLTPPARVADPVPVFVVDYGQHASLALPHDGGPDLSEWSWGDWNWFAMGRTGVFDGVRALFASRGATLSRRIVSPAADADALRQRLGAQQVLQLTVERARAAALEARLEARWRRGRGQAVTGQGGRVFVPDPGRYWLGNNSVHELNRWLRALGVEVEGAGVTARYSLADPARANKAEGGEVVPLR